MKYRTPITVDGFDPSSAEIIETENLHSVTYTVKVITPIYGGGVKAGEPDTEMPIRASAIRGQLRYWWRFLKMNDPVEKNRLDGEKLFKAERLIWGGMGDEKELKESGGKDFSSKVFLHIHNLKGFTRQSVQPCGEYRERYNQNTGRTSFPFSFHHDIPPYSLFSAQGKPPANPGAPPQELPHNVLLAPFEFSIKLTTRNIDEKDWLIIKEAFRWWVCFGGIGARTRRGLGSVEVVSSTGKPFEVLTKEDIEQFNSCKLEEINAGNAIDAWGKAVSRLQDFRQGVGTGRKRGNGNRPGQSYWPEADTIRQITGKKGHPIIHIEAIESFPRAAFGLPIVFEIRGRGEPPKTQLKPVNSERMSSSVILKAMALGGGNYKAIALCLPTENTIKELKVSLDYVNLRNDVRNQNDRRELETKLPKQYAGNNQPHWWLPSKASVVEPIENNKGTDALTAFMNFFAKGGNN